MNKKIIYLVFMALLMGCSSTEPKQHKQHKLLFNEIVVKNASFSDIEDLEVKVSNVNRVFSCSPVLAKSFCSNKFKTREYEGNTITLGWRENNQEIFKGPIVLEAPISNQEDIYTIVLTLDAGGVYRTSFKLQ